MTPDRAQRILHTWPEWDASIGDARSRLGYDPAWRPLEPHDTPSLAAFWMGEATTGPYAGWCGMHFETMGMESRLIVHHLGLGLFDHYWQACFLSDYAAQRLDAIRWDDGTRAYPPPDSFLTVTMDLTAGKPPTLEIVGPAALVTPETLRDASRRAMEGIRTRWSAGVTTHPVLVARKHQAGPGRPPKLGPDPEATIAAEALAWKKRTGARGEPTKEALADGLRVHASTVRRRTRSTKTAQ